MPNLIALPREKKKRKGTARIALVEENSSDRAGAPQCSDELTMIHRLKETGELDRQYTGRYHDPWQRPPDTEELPTMFQLELIGSESAEGVEKKTGSRDAIEMCELDGGTKRSKYFYEAKALDAVHGMYVTNAAAKRRLEEKQLELCATDR